MTTLANYEVQVADLLHDPSKRATSSNKRSRFTRTASQRISHNLSRAQTYSLSRHPGMNSLQSPGNSCGMTRTSPGLERIEPPHEIVHHRLRCESRAAMVRAERDGRVTDSNLQRQGRSHGGRRAAGKGRDDEVGSRRRWAGVCGLCGLAVSGRMLEAQSWRR